MAYVDENTIYNNRHREEVIAYIDGETIYNNRHREAVIGPVSEAKSIFPHSNDFVVAALFALLKIGKIKSSE